MAFERRVLTRYDASTTGFDRGTRRVDQQLARLQRTADTRLGAIDRRFERAGRAARRFGAALAGLASVAALRRLDAGIRNALSSLDNIDKTASRLGLTTTALQELRSAADQSGVSVGTFDMAMQRFGRRIAEARQGTGAAKGVIKEMGIALFDASGNPDGAGEITDFRPHIESQARQFVRVDSPRPFDLIALIVAGVPAHVGVTLDSVDMIHLQRGCNAVIERLDCQRWRHRLWGIYRHRDLV